MSRNFADVLGLTTPLVAQRNEKKAPIAEESGSVRSVSGGTTIQISGPYDKVFDGLVTYLKKGGYTLDAANRDSGEAATSMAITGGWHQTGRRTVISIIRDTADTTSVRVAVTVQTRYKALQTEPWSDPKVDEKASATEAKKIQAELPTTLAQS